MNIDLIAAKVREVGGPWLPDFLNRWIGMTPEAWDENERSRKAMMSKREPGERERQLQELRRKQMETQEKEASKAPQKKQKKATAASPPPSQPEPETPAPKKESEVRTPAKKSAARAKVKDKTQAKKPAGVKKPKTERKVDRRPLTIGTFISAAGDKGVTMAQIEKKFDMDAHPLRAKIFTAKHTLGFTITYDHKGKRYTGAAPATPKENAA